jgi:hypothetical protein
VRAYTAYNIANPQLYDICIWSYALAGAHFVSEWLVFGTARWVEEPPYLRRANRGYSLGAGLAGPLVVSSTSLLWMFTQRGFYTAAAAAAGA